MSNVQLFVHIFKNMLTNLFNFKIQKMMFRNGEVKLVL